MLLDDNEIAERMQSPMNLLNRLRSISKPKQSDIQSLPPSASEVIQDLEDKLAYGSIKSKAAGIMIAAMDELKKRIPEVSKPDQLARIAEHMSKVVSTETKNPRDPDENKPQYIIYAPQFNQENSYEIIHARE